MKKKIAVFASGWSPDILYQYLNGVKLGLEQEQVDIYLFLTHAVAGSVEEFIHGELNIFRLPDLSQFDAAMVLANGLDFPGVVEGIDASCKEAGIPAIFTGKKMDGSLFVGSDNRNGMTHLCEHLIEEHNVKNVWFLAGSKGNMDSAVRLETAIKVFKEHGIEILPDNIFYSEWQPVRAIDYIRKRLERGDALPEVLICANDNLAMAVISELEMHGYKVPRDLLVTGFDNEYSAQVFWPAITSVDQRFDLIGAKCAELLAKIFHGESYEMEESILCEAVIGESCDCHVGEKNDMLRRELGRKYYIETIAAAFFDMNLNLLERTVVNSKDFTDLGEKFKQVYARGHMFEGETFHILLDPLYEASVYEREVMLRSDGYSSKMDVLLSVCKDDMKTYTGFETKRLIPRLEDDADNGSNHIFILSPLQEEGKSIGYIVFCNKMELLQDMNHLRRYVERVDSVLSIYLRNRRVEVLHNRLWDMTRTDALTRVKNRAAYEEREQQLQNKMNNDPDAQFGIAIFDVNHLKMFNDQLGHEAGDAYIQASCRLICKVFKHSAVYRIGGDEFLAVLEGNDYEKRDALIEEMMAEMTRLRGEDLLPQDKVSIASGVATYKKGTDTLVKDIFSRADGRMYENKITMKSQGW